MTSTSSPADALPALSADSVLLVKRPGLLLRIGSIGFWRTGVEFTLSGRLSVEKPRVNRLVSTVFDTLHDGDLPLRLRVLINNREIALDSQSIDQQRGGYGLYPAGSHSTFGTSPISRFDDTWWLSPLPFGPTVFEVSCPGIGLEAVEGALDLAAIAQTLDLPG